MGSVKRSETPYISLGRLASVRWQLGAWICELNSADHWMERGIIACEKADTANPKEELHRHSLQIASEIERGYGYTDQFFSDTFHWQTLLQRNAM